ncbi:MAG: excinuclease ABC subunit UvrC [Cellulosilyticaceae bacterium]
MKEVWNPMAFNIEEELKKLPDNPGVYLMKNDLGQIIYVGKAINLKNRVRQYFRKSKQHSIKVIRMVENINSFEYIITQSEMEALVLECNLIKKYSPKYNIRLKDDKHYPYIKLNVQDAFPKVTIARSMHKDGAKYFGPYTDTTAMREMLEIIKKTWQLRTCSRNLPKDIGKERACLNFHIGQCSAPCIGEISEQDYRKVVEEVANFLSGKYKEVVVRLQDEMVQAADEMNFEKAALIRDQIGGIKRLEEKQRAIQSSMEDQDVIAFARSPQDTLIQVYFVRAGKLVGREHFFIEGTEGEQIETIFRDFMVQFYSGATFIPKEIIVEREPAEVEITEQFLSLKKENKVHIKLPQKGSKHGLLELASKNAELTLGQFGEHIKKEEQKTRGALEEIQKALGITDTIYRIEAYDISNTQGVQSVGGMVVFEGGKPKRSDYRKFKIKSVIGPNDYGSMEEVMERRILRYLSEKEESSFTKKPDFIFMDGGQGQITSAKKVLQKYNLSIPVCGMVKDEHHRTRGLLYEGQEVLLPIGTEGFKLVTRIQDEVHRFSIEYHRKLRGKAQIQSVLDDIKGIGKERKKLLIEHFKSVEKIRQASLEEIEAVPGIPKDVANNIHTFFHGIKEKN